jgi:hypothetical protein
MVKVDPGKAYSRIAVSPAFGAGYYARYGMNTFSGFSHADHQPIHIRWNTTLSAEPTGVAFNS